MTETATTNAAMANVTESAAELLGRARALLLEASSNTPGKAADPRSVSALASVDAALASLEAAGHAVANAVGANGSGTPERVALDAGQIGFLSTVCHDLKDPLAAVVMGSSFLLRETKGAPDGDRMQRMVQAIHRAGSRMGVLLQNLTDFVHLSTGRRAFDLRDHPLKPVLDRAIEKLRAQADTAGVRVSNDVATDLRVSCDDNAVALAVEHLLSNAIRYAPHGTEVHVDATSPTVVSDSSYALVDLRVRDSGPGVNADRMPHLFDTYWNARQKARDGVGLGLGIVRAIAEAHGTSPAVESSSRGANVGFALKKA